MIDQPLPEDEAIKAAHPLRSGRHDLYGEAMRLVGAKHSKAALVELVNWLLVCCQGRKRQRDLDIDAELRERILRESREPLDPES